jgi:hypothetical protein
MSKAIIVIDFAYRPPKRKRALRQVLKYLQYVRQEARGSKG